MISLSDGWAVGSEGVILRWDGGEWSQVDSPTECDFNSIHMVSSSEGRTTGGGGFLRWDGKSWEIAQESFSTENAFYYFNDLYALSDQAWLAGTVITTYAYKGAIVKYVPEPQPQVEGGGDNTFLIASIIGVVIILIALLAWFKRRE